MLLMASYTIVCIFTAFVMTSRSGMGIVKTSHTLCYLVASAFLFGIGQSSGRMCDCR